MQPESGSRRHSLTLAVGLILSILIVSCTWTEVRAQTPTPNGIHTAAILGVPNKRDLVVPAPSTGPGGSPSAVPQAATEAAPGIYGVVTLNGIPVQTIILELRQYDDTAEITVATTHTDATGSYRFTDVPTLPAGNNYYVRFGPNYTYQALVYLWFGPSIDTYVAGQSAAGGDFDIANIDTQWANAIGPVPGTFAWKKRNVPDDNYRWRLLDRATGKSVSSPLLGYVDQYTLGTLPEGVKEGQPYYWYVETVNPVRGVGYSFYMGIVQFVNKPLSAVLADVLDTGGDLAWTTGGDAPWFGETVETKDSVDAAQGGYLSEGQLSWLQTTITGPGLLSFYWGNLGGCPTPNCHTKGTYSRFLVDGALELSLEDAGWQPVYYQVPAGVHTFRWQYGPIGVLHGEKYVIGGYLDQVAFVPPPAIKITKPAKDDIWYQRTTEKIEWQKIGNTGAKVKIELLQSGNTVHVLADSVDNTGAFSFVVPVVAAAGGEYQVRVSSGASPTILSTTDFLSIAARDQAAYKGLLSLQTTYAYAISADDPELDVGDDPGESFTVDGWVYFPTNTAIQTPGISLAKIGSWYLAWSLQWYTYPDSQYICAFFGADTQGYGPFCVLSHRVSLWHHFALVVDGGSERGRIYLDGEAFGLFDIMDAVPKADAGFEITGVSDRVQDSDIVALLDELYISDNAAYSGDLYDVPRLRTCDQHTRALYHFDEHTGATRFNDACGANNVLEGHDGAITEGYWAAGDRFFYLPAVKKSP